MNFFNEKDLEFNWEYKEFMDALTQTERINFLYEYKLVKQELDKLLNKYNEIVAERLSLEAKKQFLEKVKQSITDKTFDYKAFFHDSVSYNLSGQEIYNTIWRVKSELP